MENILIFCQAPSDFSSILQIYDEYIDQCDNFTIVCVNHKNYAQFFKLLNLKQTHIIDIPQINISLKKIYLYRFYRKSLYNNLITYNIWRGNLTIYFTARMDDPVTAYYISLYSKDKTNKISLLSYWNDNVFINSDMPMNIKIRMILSKYLYKINFKYHHFNNRWWVPEFPIEDYSINIKEIKNNPHICEKYKYTVPIDSKSVLLFSSPHRDGNIIDECEYNNVHILLIDKLHEAGYKIYTKGHPRMGILEAIRNKIDEIIPEYIPASLFDTSSFNACFGFNTTALCEIALKNTSPTYSFIKLANYKNKEMLMNDVNFLKKLSNDKVIFFEEFNEIQKLKNTK
jgi:hypothetical protein